jgi:hypothetical protein
MARRKIFTSFSVSPITGESKDETHMVSPPHKAKRLQVVSVENLHAIPTNQKLGRDEQ